MLSAAFLLTGALALQGALAPPGAPGAPPAPSSAGSASAIADRGPVAQAPPVQPAVSPEEPQATAPPPPLDPAPAVRAERPVHDLFHNLGRDFVRLGSADTLLVAGSGAAFALAVRVADDNLNETFVARGPAGYVRAGNALGDGWTQAGAALGAYVAGLATHNAKIAHVGSDLIRGQVLNAVLTRGLKLAARRDRPSGGPDSMPSGHTSATFTTAAVLHEHFGWKAGVAGYAAAGFVGWSRLRDQHHWLTDIVIGSAIGLVSGRTVTAGHRDRPWTVVPVATHDSVGVFVSWGPRLELGAP